MTTYAIPVEEHVVNMGEYLVDASSVEEAEQIFEEDVEAYNNVDWGDSRSTDFGRTDAPIREVS